VIALLSSFAVCAVGAGVTAVTAWTIDPAGWEDGRASFVYVTGGCITGGIAGALVWRLGSPVNGLFLAPLSWWAAVTGTYLGLKVGEATLPVDWLQEHPVGFWDGITWALVHADALDQPMYFYFAMTACGAMAGLVTVLWRERGACGEAPPRPGLRPRGRARDVPDVPGEDGSRPEPSSAPHSDPGGWTDRWSW
jgi:hypothetical protein